MVLHNFIATTSNSKDKVVGFNVTIDNTSGIASSLAGITRATSNPVVTTLNPLHMLCYFFLGNLPWQNPEGATQQQRDACVLKQKLDFQAEMSLYGFPDELQAFLAYTCGLEFNEDPNYFHLDSPLNLYDGIL